MDQDQERDLVPVDNSAHKTVTCPDCGHVFYVEVACKLAECSICATEFRV